MTSAITSNPQPAPIPVVGARPGTTVMPMPGKTYVPLPAEAVDPVAVAEMVPAGDGTFRLVARVCPRWFPLSKKTLPRLGVGVSAAGMRRLIVAGFVVGRQVTPGIYQFDLRSYQEHERQTADPEFWLRVEPGQKKTNRQRFSEAI